jgi:hypothetical protein
MEPAKPPFYSRIFTLTWEGAYQWLVGIALGLIVAQVSQFKMPTAVAHPAQYWLSTAIAFVLPVLAFVALSETIIRSRRRFKRWRHPSFLTVIPGGGKIAAIQLDHHGQPATWKVQIRIAQMLDNSVNPDPLLHSCYLHKDSKSFRELLLKEGETASVTLAEIQRSHPLSSTHKIWMEVQNADGGVHVGLGVVLEIGITAEPELKNGRIKKYFRVTWEQTDTLKCIEIN